MITEFAMTCVYIELDSEYLNFSARDFKSAT